MAPQPQTVRVDSDSLANALFPGPPADDLTKLGTAFRGTTQGSNVISNLPLIIQAVQQGRLEDRMAIIRACRETQDPGLAAQLVAYLRAPAAEDRGVRAVVVDIVATLPGESVDAQLRELALARGERLEVRRSAFAGLASRKAPCFADTVSSLLAACQRDSTKGDDYQAASNAANIFVGCAAPVLDQLVETLKHPHVTADLVKAIVSANDPRGRAALFEIGLDHEDSLVRYHSAFALKDMCKELTAAEEGHLARALLRDSNGSIYRETLEMLRGARSPEAIDALIRTAQPPSRFASEALYALAKDPLAPDSPERGARNQQLLAAGMAERLMRAAFQTTRYGPPSTYYPVQPAIAMEIACRCKGAELLAMSDTSDKSIRDATLELLWANGMEHQTLGEYHTQSQRAAAKAIQTILARHRLAYKDPAIMTQLHRFCR